VLPKWCTVVLVSVPCGRYNSYFMLMFSSCAVVIVYSPHETFLTMMNTDSCCWPSKGSFKVSEQRMEYVMCCTACVSVPHCRRPRKPALSILLSRLTIDVFSVIYRASLLFCLLSALQVVRELDDHADIIAVELVTDTTQYGGKSANLVSSLSTVYRLFLSCDVVGMLWLHVRILRLSG
jgi:hypothetical protein